MALNVIFLLLIATSLFTDVRYNKVYNWITLPAIGMGILLNALSGRWVSVREGLIGVGVGFLLLSPLFFSGGVGAGDIKLLAGIGAIKGPLFVFWSTVYGLLLSGLIILVIWIYKKTFIKSLKRTARFIFTLLSPGLKPEYIKKEESERIPLGAALSLGAFIFWMRGFLC